MAWRCVAWRGTVALTTPGAWRVACGGQGCCGWRGGGSDVDTLPTSARLEFTGSESTL